MKQPEINGELFPDADAIRKALERQTRDALLHRLGPATVVSAETAPLISRRTDPEERSKARGIGFGVDLVRAILDGRKSQTRRLVRPPTDAPPRPEDCPAARVGELLYVREPWLRVADAGHVLRTRYAADASHKTPQKFRPAMYMPRDAARLWLRVRSIRVERLQAITPEDLAAEGVPAGQTLAGVWDTFYTGPGERYADDPWVWVIGFLVEAE